jgi:hypothetical protein
MNSGMNMLKLKKGLKTLIIEGLPTQMPGFKTPATQE